MDLQISVYNDLARGCTGSNRTMQPINNRGRNRFAGDMRRSALKRTNVNFVERTKRNGWCCGFCVPRQECVKLTNVPATKNKRRTVSGKCGNNRTALPGDEFLIAFWCLDGGDVYKFIGTWVSWPRPQHHGIKIAFLCALKLWSNYYAFLAKLLMR